MRFRFGKGEILFVPSFLTRDFRSDSAMIGIFKNPWTWLFVLFLSGVFFVGVILFGGKSQVAVENEAVEKSEKQEKLSQEDTKMLVEELEAETSVPAEVEEEQETEVNEQGTTNTEQGTSPSAGGNEHVRQLTEGSEEQDEQSKGDVEIINKLVSWGFEETKGRKIDTVVLHSTYNALGGDPFSVEKILGIYKSYGVSPHYLIARDGVIYRLVEEKNIAFHAGESEMKDGRKNVNDFSIGIEIVGKDDGSPSKEQYEALRNLLADIKSRNDIEYVVGHSDIAPGRKTDPWGFEWGDVGGKEL